MSGSLNYYVFVFDLQIEPILSGNLPPGFDPSSCRSVWVSCKPNCLFFPFCVSIRSLWTLLNWLWMNLMEKFYAATWWDQSSQILVSAIILLVLPLHRSKYYILPVDRKTKQWISFCGCRYVGNIHPQVTEPLLQEVFSSTGPLEGCKLIRKEKVWLSCSSFKLNLLLHNPQPFQLFYVTYDFYTLLYNLFYFISG